VLVDRPGCESATPRPAIYDRGLTAMIGSHSVRRGRTAFFVLLPVASLAVAFGAAAQDGSPARMVTFFNAAACPPGWNPASIGARGNEKLAETGNDVWGSYFAAPITVVLAGNDTASVRFRPEFTLKWTLYSRRFW
jgi:hypothetical protein